MAEQPRFGTSGVRGPAAEVEKQAGSYAAAFIRHLKGDAGHGDFTQVLIGRDLRDSSPNIAAQVARAVGAAGLDAVDCGALPTPALALEAMRLRLPAVMVTGSHIPADRNGLKFYRSSGEVDKTDEAAMLRLLRGGAEPPGSDGPINGSDAALRHYRQRCQAVLPRDALAGTRIGVYQHSGVARELLPAVLASYGATVLELGWSDAFVALDTEAVGADLAGTLAGWVRQHRLDALVSTDGDADRPLLVDDTGAIVRGDLVGLLTARFVDAEIVVTPVTSNSAVERCGRFWSVVRTQVGSPYVLAAMSGAEAGGGGRVIGFEANGGVLLGGGDWHVAGGAIAPLPTRDAMLPILAILGMARQRQLSVGQLVRELPQRFTASDRLQHVPPTSSGAFLHRLDTDADFAALFFGPAGLIADVSRLDGLRFTLADGDTLHFRASGNAPELRCYAEAGSAARADQLCGWGLQMAGRIIGS